MYLRQLGDGQLVQGYVRTRWPTGAEAAGRIANWARLFRASVALWSQFRPRSVAVRLTNTPGQSLVSVHAFVTEAAEAGRLRQVLAAFLRTDQIASGHTEVPLTAEDIQADEFELRNAARVGIVPERLSTSDGNALRYNVRLSELVGRILETASGLGLPCSYEMQAAGWSMPREVLRTVLYDASHLQDSAAAPADLVRDQAQLADRLRRAQWHVEECITSPVGAEPLSKTLGHVLEGTIYARLGAPPAVSMVSPQQAASFTRLIHSSQLVAGWTPSEGQAVAGAESREGVEAALACRAAGIDAMLAYGAAAVGPTSPTLIAPGGPMLQQSGGPFLFISYARTDGERVYPLVEGLRQRGVSVWIDRQLQTGDAWLDELEQKLNQSSGLLAFVSPAFMASRYCGREVRYADALSRQLFPVYLEPTELMGSLRFILQPLQGMTVSDARSNDRLLDAIRHHAPAVLRSI
jgi:hypothetical protein